MDEKTFYNFTHSVKFDESMTFFWAPETYIIALFHPRTADHEAYLDNCIKAFNEVYDGRGEKILRAGMVLFENCNSFKNRINGSIEDDWLSEKIFGSIAQDCVTVLDTIPQLEDWQVQLKEKFKNMKWSEEPQVPEVVDEEEEEMFDYMNKYPEKFNIIGNFIIQSCKIFNDDQSNMTMFTHPDVPLDEVIRVFNWLKKTNYHMKDIRSAIGADGKLCLVHMPKQQDENNKEEDPINKTPQPLDKIVI